MTLSGKSNINPKIWGPYIWKTIHFVAHGYPKNPNDEDKKVYHDFYENLMKVLPCDKCSISSQDLFKISRIKSHLDSKDELIKWAYNFHDSVNNKLNKVSPSFEDYMYNFTNQNSYFNYEITIPITIPIIILLILILLFYFKS